LTGSLLAFDRGHEFHKLRQSQAAYQDRVV
jgi:hypothetical protein